MVQGSALKPPFLDPCWTHFPHLGMAKPNKEEPRITLLSLRILSFLMSKPYARAFFEALETRRHKMFSSFSIPRARLKALFLTRWLEARGHQNSSLSESLS